MRQNAGYKVLLMACMSAIMLPTLGAQDSGRDVPLFTYGLEWSYSALFNAAWHHNFIEDGGRADDRGTRFFYENHGEILAHGGVNIGGNANVSLYCGYSGLIRDVRYIPVTLRFTWFFGNIADTGRWFAFLDGGSGIYVSKTYTPNYAGKAGGGYRISLSRRAKMDFNIAYRLSYASPDIYSNGVKVPESDINRNENYLSAFMIGIGLTF